MSFYPPIFTRLETPQRMGTQRLPQLCQALVVSLGHLLSARVGQSPAVPQYGVLGGSHGLRALLCEVPRTRPDIAAVLKHAIVQGEPRLSDVDVVCSVRDAAFEPADIAFVLRASFLETPNVKRAFHARLVLKSTGHVVIEAAA